MSREHSGWCNDPNRQGAFLRCHWPTCISLNHRGKKKKFLCALIPPKSYAVVQTLKPHGHTTFIVIKSDSDIFFPRSQLLPQILPQGELRRGATIFAKYKLSTRLIWFAIRYQPFLLWRLSVQQISLPSVAWHFSPTDNGGGGGGGTQKIRPRALLLELNAAFWQLDFLQLGLLICFVVNLPVFLAIIKTCFFLMFFFVIWLFFILLLPSSI